MSRANMYTTNTCSSVHKRTQDTGSLDHQQKSQSRPIPSLSITWINDSIRGTNKTNWFIRKSEVTSRTGLPSVSDYMDCEGLERHIWPVLQWRGAAYAFVSSRLDYCNSLLRGIAGNLPQKLQSVQNAAARLFTKDRGISHQFPGSCTGYQFDSTLTSRLKLAVLVYKALHAEM